MGFTKGDRIIINLNTDKYGGMLVGKIGVIDHVFRSNDFKERYAVHFEDIINRYTPSGLFWFSEENMSLVPSETRACYLPKIKKVIFNPPATIIFWQDDTKTVVKAVNEPYDPEKGLAMAISKKAFGNNQSYYGIFERNLKNFNSNTPYADDGARSIAEAFERFGESIIKNFSK